eukprot:COSAG05_NODE_7885_length_759_cov_1.587879_1_plen_48_part_10
MEYFRPSGSSGPRLTDTLIRLVCRLVLITLPFGYISADYPLLDWQAPG